MYMYIYIYVHTHTHMCGCVGVGVGVWKEISDIVRFIQRSLPCLPQSLLVWLQLEIRVDIKKPSKSIDIFQINVYFSQCPG